VKITKQQGQTATILEFGSGVGKYVKFYRENGITTTGMDGLENVEKLSNGLVQSTDFTTELPPEIRPAEVVLCLEVGEHIPPQKTDLLLNNLVSKTQKVLILSWAVPGQGGDGHINEMPNRQVIEMVERRGLKFDRNVSEHIRHISTLTWFKNTILVFRKY